jgi:hypothetical protein
VRPAPTAIPTSRRLARLVSPGSLDGPAGAIVVTTLTGEPAVVVTVGESSALLRHLDGDLRQSPLRVLAPDPLDPAGTCRSLLGQDAL